jgi:hypothetical protein
MSGPTNIRRNIENECSSTRCGLFVRCEALAAGRRALEGAGLERILVELSGVEQAD